MKEKQWKIYEQEAKAEYLKERKRFELALQKIDQEIKEVTGNGQEASKQVQALATNGLATKQARADNGREMWETMLAEPEAAPEPGFFRDALLAAQQAKAQPTAHSASGSAESGLMTAEAATQLLQATLAQLPSEVLRAMGTVPTAESTLGPSWGLGTSGGGTAPTAPTAPAGPYLASPTLATPGPGLGTGTGTLPSPGQKPKGHLRQPVKGAPLQPVHTLGHSPQLASKLEAARQAMYPFGVPPPGLRMQEGHCAEQTEQSGHRTINVDEEDAAKRREGPTDKPDLDGMG